MIADPVEVTGEMEKTLYFAKGRAFKDEIR